MGSATSKPPKRGTYRLDWTAIEPGADPLLLVDADADRIRNGTAAACTLLEYSREALLAIVPTTLVEPPADLTALLADARRTGAVTRSGMRWVTSSGRVVAQDVTGIRLDGPDGAAVLLILRPASAAKPGDRSAPGSVDAQMRQSQKMEALGTLVGGVAHSFNNILLAILGYSEIVREEYGAGTVAGDNAEQVLIAARRAQGLVRQILTFSRQTEAELEPIDLRGLLGEAEQLLRATLPSTINIATPPDGATDATVLGDASQLLQLLLNLGSNAAHAMRGEGGDLTFEITDLEINEERSELVGVVRPGPYIGLTVGDTGAGMDADVVPRIFDPFFTTKRVGEGTGLGLSAVHGIVLGHGGAIRVDTRRGEGTRFSIFLPRSPRRDAGRPPPTPLRRTGSERILFVDDEDQIASLGRMMLGRLGYDVTSTTSSEKAVALFTEAPDAFDVLIVDYTMPMMTGMDVARACRRHRPDVPVILTTGNSDVIEGIELETNPVSHILTKPYNIRQLVEVLRSVLDGANGGAP